MHSGSAKKTRAPCTITPIVSDKENSLYRYAVLGDGLCVLHAVLAHHPIAHHIAVLSAVDGHKDRIENLYQAHLRKRVADYLEYLRTSVKESSAPEFVENLQQLAVFAKGGAPPSGLRGEHVPWLSRFFGIAHTIPIVTSVPQYRTALQAFRKKSAKGLFRAIWIEDSTEVPEDKTAPRIRSSHATPCFSSPTVRFDLEKAMEDIKRHAESEEAKEQIRLLCLAVGAQATMLSRSVSGAQAPEMPGQLKTDQKREALIEAAKGDTESILRALSAPADQREKVSYVPMSKFVVKNGVVTFHYSHDFSNVGPHMAKQLEGLNVQLFRLPHKYSHASLRIGADYQHMFLLAEAMNVGLLVIEHAAKVHKVMGWIGKSAELKDKILFTRPVCPATRVVDEAYLASHAAILEETKTQQATIGEVALTMGEDATSQVVHVLQDVLYYDEVVADLALLGVGARVFFSAMNYPQCEGRFDYADDEGYFVIQNGFVKSFPKQNLPGYRHPLLNMPVAPFSWKLGPGKYLNAIPVQSFTTGEYSAHTAYKAVIGAKPAEDVIPVKNHVEPMTLPLLEHGGKLVITGYEKGKPVYKSTAAPRTLKFGTRPVLPDWTFQNWVSKRADYKPADLKAVENQFKSLSRTARESGLFGHLTTSPSGLQDQLLFWATQQNQAHKLTKAVFAAPEFANPDNQLVTMDHSETFFERIMAWTRKTFVDRRWFFETREHHLEAELPDLNNIGAVKKDRALIAESSTPNEVPATHFNPEVCAKFFHPVGNEYLHVTKGPDRAVECTCTPDYKLLVGNDVPTHFGSCLLNCDAALFARQFNTGSRPATSTAALFMGFVGAYVDEHLPAMLEKIRAFSDHECSFAQFLEDSDPAKRKVYQQGWDTFLDKGYLPMHLEQFSKTNEVHYDAPKDVRPRNLFNPSSECKAVGGLLARLMIKVMKTVEPGFISGYSEEDLAQKFKADAALYGIDSNSADFFSYDGSSHDAHQHPELIEMVDHTIMRRILPELLNKTEVPAHLHEHVIKQLTLSTVKFTSKTGMRGEMTGTVFSGHPTRTTLFNTLRSILYNRFVMAVLNPAGKFLVYASGDDIFCWCHNMSKWSSQTKRDYVDILGKEFRVAGLGQVAKDFRIGPIHEHSFLSKKLYLGPDSAAVHRLNARLLKAGSVQSSKSPLTPGQHALAQYLCALSLPDHQAPFRDRWIPLADRNLGRKTLDFVKADWALKLRYEAVKPDSTFDPCVLLWDDEEPLFRAMRDAEPVHYSRAALRQ